MNATELNKMKQTIAIALAYRKIIPPRCWYHDPLLADAFGYTVAACLANYGITVPEEWLHDPSI